MVKCFFQRGVRLIVCITLLSVGVKDTVVSGSLRNRALQIWWKATAPSVDQEHTPFVPISSQGITWTVLATPSPSPPTPPPVASVTTQVYNNGDVIMPTPPPPFTPNISDGYLTRKGRSQILGSLRETTTTTVSPSPLLDTLPPLPSTVNEESSAVKNAPRPPRGDHDGTVSGLGREDAYWSEADVYQGQKKGEWCNIRWTCETPNVCKTLLWGQGECRPVDEDCPPPERTRRYSYDCSIIGDIPEVLVKEEAPPASPSTPSIPSPLEECYKWGMRYSDGVVLSTKWDQGPYQCQTTCQALDTCKGINYDSETRRCDILSNFRSIPSSAKVSHLAAPRTCGWISQTTAFGLNAATEQWVTLRLATMTPEEKVGQMVIVPTFNIDSPKDLETYSLGAVLWPPGMYIEDTQTSLAERWDSYYDASMKKEWNAGGASIPPLISVDAVHGNGNAKDATLFPHNIGLGCTNDTTLLQRIGAVTAKESAATGTDWILAPTVAISRDQRWGRTYEAYSDDPETVDRLANSLLRGMQGDPMNKNTFLGHNKQMGTCKHWVGDGGAQKGMTDGDTQTSEEDLRDVHALPYYGCIRDNAVQSIMPSFTSVNMLEMHGHKFLLTDVLKNTLGFDGILVGDYNGHARSGDDPNGETLNGCSVDFCPFAIHAGIDMLMIGGDWKSFISKTSAALRSGEIDVSRVDDAVRRILRVKSRMHLIGPNPSSLKGRPSSRPEVSESRIGNLQHIALAREAVHKSVVLLKNKNQILPLKGQHRFFITGRLEKDIPLPNFKPSHVGAWSLSWQNTDTTNANFPSVSSIWEAAQLESTRSNGWSVLDTSSGNNLHGGYSAAIVVLGEIPYAETPGDLGEDTLALHQRFPQDFTLLEKLREKAPQVPRICILLSGRPLYINQHINLCDAFIVAWLPGTAGGVGIVDLLTGRKDFTAKLSMNWPATPCQTNVHDVTVPQSSSFFPSGYGLTSRDISSVGELSIDWNTTTC